MSHLTKENVQLITKLFAGYHLTNQNIRIMKIVKLRLVKINACPLKTHLLIAILEEVCEGIMV